MSKQPGIDIELSGMFAEALIGAVISLPVLVTVYLVWPELTKHDQQVLIGMGKIIIFLVSLGALFMLGVSAYIYLVRRKSNN